jgi:formylmethanofuran dehydrogenase subunit E
MSALDLNVAELMQNYDKDEMLKKRIKRLVQVCLENPELNVHVIEMFLQRQIDWGTIKRYVQYGQTVKCKLCGETLITGFWCKPCFHPDLCCYCCILLGFFRYG